MKSVSVSDNPTTRSCCMEYKLVALLVTMFKNGQNVPLNHVTVIPLFNSERPNTGWRLTLQTETIRLQMKEEDFVYL